MVPGLGFLPRLFSSSWAISAPVRGCFRASHTIRNDRKPLETHSVMCLWFGFCGFIGIGFAIDL